MKERWEYEIRFKAIRIYEETSRFCRTLETVRRSRGWLAKWIHRYKAFGLDGLRDQSRAPRHVRNRTREPLVRKILALRDELEAHKTRRAAFAGIGAETIHFELQRRGIRRLLAVSTIEKILARAGKTKKIKAQLRHEQYTMSLRFHPLRISSRCPYGYQLGSIHWQSRLPTV